MRQEHRTGSEFEKFVRVLWPCPSCNASEWRKYGAESNKRATLILVAIGAVAATLFPPMAYADFIVFQSRVSFARAIDANPGLAKSVEGWDTYLAGTVFSDGSTVNGISYAVSTGDALVVNTGISLSPPNNLYQTAAPDGGPILFRPLVDTFTFGFNQPILAFGITFSSTFANHNGDYLLTTDAGDVIPSFFDPVFPGFSLGQFAGFIANEPFNKVVVSSTVNALYGMDDLIFAREVPETSTFLLLTSGFLWLIAAARARE